MNQIIRESNSDILVVCLGCPKQEKYVYENQEKYQIPVSVCAGAADVYKRQMYGSAALITVYSEAITLTPLLWEGTGISLLS